MRTYDPLSVDELGQNAARALISYPAVSLPPDGSFTGAGVYTLHYVGSFPAYVGMEDEEPIYVGKANPPGSRRGRKPAVVSGRAHYAHPSKHARTIEANEHPDTGEFSLSRALYSRLSKHARSIETVANLDIVEFRCRWLVLDPVWIGLTEQVLISEYQPLWNVVVEGFGINAPGRGRRNQVRSQWDTVHPGRPEVANLPDREESAAEILASIASHRAERTR